MDYVSNGAVRAEVTADSVRSAQRARGQGSWTPSARPVLRPLSGMIEEEHADLVTMGRGIHGQVSHAENARDLEDLPQSFDWRLAQSGAFATQPEAQGACGACVAFAGAATLEMQLAIACQSDARPFRLSQQYLFSCGGGKCQGGMLMSKAIEFLVDSGTTDYGCFPYLSGADGTDRDCSAACSNADRRRVRVFRTEQPTAGFIDYVAIKKALLKGPLLSSLVLYEDLPLYRSGVYRHVTGERLGSHAVVIVGWSDSDRAWIVRNSWGEQWGDLGYGLVAWDDSATLLGRYTWRFDVSEAVRAGICALPR